MPIQSSVFILRLPVQSQSSTIKIVEHRLSVLLLDLLAIDADPDVLTREVEIDGTRTTTYTLLKETDQSVKDLLQYLMYPYHFPINNNNYTNLLRLALKFQAMTLVEELIVYMNGSTDHETMFLEACKHKLEPVMHNKEELVVAKFPEFILGHTSEQLSVVSSSTLSTLLQKFLDLSKIESAQFKVLNVVHLQAFRLLYSYAMQGILYTDMLQVSSTHKSDHVASD